MSKPLKAPLTVELLLSDRVGDIMPKLVFKTTEALANELKSLEGQKWMTISNWLSKTARIRETVPLIGEADMVIDVRKEYMFELDRLRGVTA
jgi:hypothetical protein